MHINYETLQQMLIGQTVQSVLMSARLLDYFQVACELTGIPFHETAYRDLLQYTAVDPYYLYDFSDVCMGVLTETPDITLGEMLRIGANMLQKDLVGGEFLEIDDTLEQELEETGRKIIASAFLQPMLAVLQAAQNHK